MNTQSVDIDRDSQQEESDVFLYDFNHPQHRLGKPTTSLTVSGEKLASQLSLLLDTVLHVSSDISLVSTDYRKHSELMQSLDENACIFKAALDPQSVDALILLDRDVILSLVASYFGGSAERTQAAAIREFSAAERRMAERLRVCVTDVIQSIWRNCFTVSATNVSMLSPEELAITGSEESVVAAFKYGLKCNENESFLTIVLPWAAVKTIQRCYNVDNVNNDIENQHWCTRLQEHLENCHVDLQGKIAETEVTVQQLFNMQVGDFIPLGDPGAATFLIDNTPVFEAEIGESNGLVSASILRWMDQGEK